MSLSLKYTLRSIEAFGGLEEEGDNAKQWTDMVNIQSSTELYALCRELTLHLYNCIKCRPSDKVSIIKVSSVVHPWQTTCWIEG